MYKKLTTVIFLCLMMATCFISFADVHELEVETELGFDGVIKTGNYVPITIKIKNNGEDIKGKLEILIPIDRFGDEEVYKEIVSEIEIPKGTTKVIKTGVFLDENYIGAYYSKIYFKSQGQTKLFNFDNEVEKDSSEYIIGVLSDDSHLKSIINSVTVKKNNRYINMTPVDLKENFHEYTRDFDMIDLIVIKDFNKEVLNEKQLAAYEELIKQKKVIFTSELKKLNPDADINLVLKTKIHDYIYNDSSPSQLTYQSGHNYGNWAIERIIGSIPSERLPSLSTVVIIIISFIIIVGPINYFVLKKMDKTQYTWYSMTGIAVFYILVIFVLGKTTTLNSRFSNEINLVKVNAKLIVNEGVFGINGSNESSEIGVKTNGYITNYDFNNYRSGNLESGVKYTIKDEEYKLLKFNNSKVFNFNYAKVNEKISNENPNLQVLLSGSHLSGEIDLNLDYDLIDAVLVFKDKKVSLGTIAPGKYQIDFDVKNDLRQFHNMGIYSNSNMVDRKFDTYNNIISSEMFSDLNQSNISSGLKIIAWSKESPFDVSINGKETEREVNSLNIIELDLKYEIVGKEIISKGIVMPNIIENTSGFEIDSDRIYAYSDGSIAFEFTSSKEFEIDEFLVEIQDLKQNKVEILNYSTKKYEDITFKNETSNGLNISVLKLNKEELDSYLTEENSLILRVELKSNDQFLIPTYSVKGGRK